MKFQNQHWYGVPLLSKPYDIINEQIIFYKLIRLSLWIINNCIENYQGIVCKTNLAKYFPYTHFCIHIMCRFSNTGIILMSQRIVMHEVHLTMGRLFTIHKPITTCFRTLLADFGFVMYEKKYLCHNKALVLCTMHCEIGGPKGALSKSVHSVLCALCTDWALWLLHTSYLTMHDTSCSNQ